jgi:TetR/AcrR family transcriptional regulator, repressor of the mexAB-oprM multidrug resistance operon
MARRSKNEAEETREHIIEAAIRLFLKDGVAHTTLEKIAAEAGHTRGAVYHHFENKATLLLELLKEVRPPAEAMFNSVSVDLNTDPLGAMKEALEKTLVAMLSNKRGREIHTIFIHNCEFVEKENPIFKLECHYGQVMRKIVSDAFVHAQELGQMRKDVSPDQASIMLHAFCFGIYSLALKNPWEDYQDNLIPTKSAIDIFFRGLRTGATID